MPIVSLKYYQDSYEYRSYPSLVSSNITKYYQLFDQLTPEAAVNVARGNAERLYFDNWKVPSGDVSVFQSAEAGHYAKVAPYYQTECLDPKEGTFVSAGDIFDDNGKY